MVQIEGYVSKKVIRQWLENYEYMEVGDRPPDAPVTNSGPKSADGIKGGQLNKLMLDQAIEELPLLERACVKARWVHRFSPKQRRKMCERLGITNDMYRSRSEQSVKLLHDRINGEVALYKRLFDKINKP